MAPLATPLPKQDQTFSSIQMEEPLKRSSSNKQLQKAHQPSKKSLTQNNQDSNGNIKHQTINTYYQQNLQKLMKNIEHQKVLRQQSQKELHELNTFDLDNNLSQNKRSQANFT